MPAKRQELVVNELIVTGPLKERLYDLFTRVYAGRNDVRVIMDRRGDAPARRRSEPAPAEHREPDRRRRPPTWVFPPSD